MSDLDEVVREFLVESYEGLDQLDRNLVALEQRPGDRELLAAIFRCIHTIKGTCGFLGFGKLESVSHVGESLLSLLRDGRLELTPEITSALLRLVDAVRQILANIEATQAEGDTDYGDLIELLTRLAEQEPEQAQEQTQELESEPGREPAAAAPSGPTPAVVDVLPSGEPLLDRRGAERRESDRRDGERRQGTPAEGGEAEVKSSAISDSNIRVDVGLLDKLMNLVGELVLARNQILQFSATLDDSTLQTTTQRLNLITTELQEGVMKTRMQPIGNIWSKFPRIVRDLALACNKQVHVEMEGRETELDKTIIESIKDPLTHIVRNSVDHGIEPPHVRAAAGKPAEGRLFLRAYHEGGKVNIEISDDGGGINVDRVKQKAIERGLITADQATRMGDREVFQLIFMPGFSTAEQITNVSGRGVGMDVVKTNIEKIGGTVDVQSKLGEGTTLKIKIPLTLAIIPALVVTSGGDRYAIPQVSLLELVRLEGNEGQRGIETIYGAPVYRLRGNLLPLVYLNRELALKAPGADAAGGIVNIVVLQADDRSFGLVVDEINDTEEIVVKPLGKQLKGIPAFAGATIMGDGRVALILDVLGLAQRANVVSETRDRSRTDAAGQAQQHGAARQALLLFGVGKDRRVAIPLSIVSRLEEIRRSVVELAGGREVVQYRGQILPLLRLSTLLNVESVAADRDPMQVVVYSDGTGSVGLVVDAIVDIVEEVVSVERRHGAGAVYGSAVIQQRVTDLLDVAALVRGVSDVAIEPALVPAGAA
jgi:two-component system chemotaxis sensor kinase CheA